MLTLQSPCVQVHPQRQAWQAESEAVTATVSVQKSQWGGKRADAVVKAMAHVQEMERPGMLSGIKDQVCSASTQ